MSRRQLHISTHNFTYKGPCFICFKEREEVEFIIEDAIDVIELFSKNRQDAVKKASERRIIDVI